MLKNSMTIPENSVAQEDEAFTDQHNMQDLNTLRNASEDISISQCNTVTCIEQQVDSFKHNISFEGLYSKNHIYDDCGVEYSKLVVDKRKSDADLVATNSPDYSDYRYNGGGVERSTLLLKN